MTLRILSLLLIACSAAFAQPQQMPTVAQVPAAAQASPNFDAKAATDAWMAEIPAASTARPEDAITFALSNRFIPAMPMADNNPPMVVGARQTSNAMSTVILTGWPLCA